MEFFLKGRFLLMVSLLFQWSLSGPLAAKEGHKPKEGGKKEVWLTIGSDTIKTLQKNWKKDGFSVEGQNKDISLLRMEENDLPVLSGLMHEEFGRCGGFIVHETRQQGLGTLESYAQGIPKNNYFVDYTITEQDTVNSLIPLLQENRIRGTIEKLSSFHNRYYQSEMGVSSSNWIKDHWKSLTQARTDVRVEAYNHPRWPQPSIILTIQGSTIPEEVVVVGGHADSIAGFWNRQNARAPGADDNASGISVMTEVIRVIMEKGIRPSRTVKFMAYAAEEVGLLGSNDIAQSFKGSKVNVVGVLQLDMTNMKAGDLDIVMMSDYTDANQNKFIGNLVDQYVHVPWGYSKCGYGCSDHVSWNKNGYPASIPFETKMELSNKNIHTANDTLASSGGNAEHSLKFAKLALSFMIEMAK